MTFFRRIVISFIIAFFAMPAWALSLEEARTSGALGETLEGYVSVLQPSAEAQQLAADVNAKRKAEYQRISKENGQPVDVVAKLAAAQIIQKLPAGSRYQAASGWVQK